MKHTQGPWKAVNYQNTSYYTVRQEHEAYGIDAETIVGSDVDINFHNAHLIAAAPDLLRELIEILELFETKNLKSESKSLDAIIIQDLKDVIKKAKGE